MKNVKILSKTVMHAAANSIVHKSYLKDNSYTKNKTRHLVKHEAENLEFSQQLSDIKFVELNYLKSIQQFCQLEF